MRTLVESSKVTGGLDRAWSRLIARRLSIFASGWLGAIGLWLVVFTLMDRLPVAYAAAVLAGHVLLFAGVVAMCRQHPSASWARAVAVGLCLVLGVVLVVLCVAVRTSGDLLAFMLLMLDLGAALVFAWGWRAELTLVVGTTMSWVLGLLSLRILLSPLELAAGVAVSGIVSLAVAEGAARSFRIAFLRRESEERFRIAFGRAPVGMAIVDLDGRPVEVNDAVGDMLGYDQDELLARGTTGVTHPDDIEKTRAWRRAVLAGSSAPLEMRFVRKEGGIIQGLVSASLVREAAGRVLYGLVQVQDVTVRKDTEDALRASESRYRSLVESQSDFIFRIDLEGCFTFVNDACCRKTGLARDALIGLDAFTLVPEDAHARLREAIATVGHPPHELRGLTRGWTSSDWRWFEWEAAGIKDAAGHVVELQAVARDVTGRVQNELALQESEARFRGLVESEMAMFVRFDLEGNVTYVNDQACRFLGLTREEFLGTPFPAVVHEDEREPLRVLMEAHRNGLSRGRLEHRLRTSAGWRWTEWEGHALRDEQGQILEIQAVGHDIQDRKESEAALRESEERLRLLTQRQSTIRDQERKRLGLDLHDDVCQELVGIGIMVASIRWRVGPVSTETANEFDRVGRYLGQLIDHLRLLAHELQPLQLQDLGLQGGLRALSRGMSSETCTVNALFPTLVPRLTEDAEVGVYRIAQEALTNAVRHADAQTIELVLAVAGSMLCLEVCDDGRGFDPEDRAHALGLVGMEERALSLGGRLTIRSSADEGTTVRLECPLDGHRSTSAA